MEFLSVLFIILVLTLLFLITSLKIISWGLKVGIFFVGVGLLIWLGNLHLLPIVNWDRDWPWILVFLGLWIISKPLFGRRPKRALRKKIENVIKDLEAGKITPEEAEKKIKSLK